MNILPAEYCCETCWYIYDPACGDLRMASSRVRHSKAFRRNGGAPTAG